MVKKIKKIHFMGIGGSAVAGVAILAKKFGFEVSGCDLEETTIYSETLKNHQIPVFLGHSSDHLKEIDLLIVSPAVLFTDPLPEEVIEAQKKRILLTWQEFLGQYLQKDKTVLAVAGTHGKSTTTALLGLLLEGGNLDPIVEVGAIIPQWQATVRFGNSNYFVCEADEFNNNFLNYSPGLIIINNLEMDHPEFFKDFNDFKNSFKKFIQRIKEPKILIVNEGSSGVQEILEDIKDWLVENRVKVIGFYIDHHFSFPFAKEYQGLIVQKENKSTSFQISGNQQKENFQINLPGRHLVMNSLAALAAGFELGLDAEIMRKTLKDFQGVGRRFELVGEEKDIKVYDDYAVHPTAVEATLKALKQKYPQDQVWAVFEPHQYSRFKLFLNAFVQSFALADKVIITSIYPGREKEDKSIKPEDLVKKIGKKAFYEPDFNVLANNITQKATKGTVIIVLGAGKSHHLSRKVLENLKQKND